MRSLFPFLLTCLVLSGCGSAGERTEVIVRDSVGITIVEHDDQPAPQTWTVSTDPVVVIGTRDGVESQMLFRVAAAFRLADGRIVLANGGSTEFRFYDSSGVHIRSVGGAGGGPGEMRVLFEVTRLDGDTLVAFDPAMGRLDWFDASGTFIHRTNMNLRGLLAPPYFSEGAHLLADHTVLMRVYEGTNSPLPPGVFRANLGFFRFHPESGVMDTLMWTGGLENFIIDVDGRSTANARPFARRSLEAWSANAVYVVDTDRYEIQAFSLDNTTRMIIRRAHNAPTVTPDDRAAFEGLYREFMSRNPSREGEMNRWLAAVSYPETKPPISGLRTDRLGHVWVRETAAEQDEADVWSVFDDTGQLVAQADLPSDLTPLDIGSDYILGRVRDADDVEYVHLHSLSKARAIAPR